MKYVHREYSDPYILIIVKYVTYMTKTINLEFELRSYTFNITSAISLYLQRVLIRKSNKALIRIIY